MCPLNVLRYNRFDVAVLLLGFLTGVQQNHARKLGISVDSLVFNFHVKTKATDTEESLCDLKHKPAIRTAAFKVGVFERITSLSLSLSLSLLTFSLFTTSN